MIRLYYNMMMEFKLSEENSKTSEDVSRQLAYFITMIKNVVAI